MVLLLRICKLIPDGALVMSRFCECFSSAARVALNTSLNQFTQGFYQPA